MRTFSPVIERLITELTKLPSIGRKSAERLAFHLLKSDPKQAEALAKAIMDVKQRIIFCSQCFNATETDPCAICANPERDHSTVCVVEDPLNVLAIEKTGGYNGIYHVLQGRLSALRGVTPDDLRIKELLARVSGGEIKEVIIATNPDVDGDTTALYLSKMLKPLPVTISRIGLGIPMGGSLEYVDEATLKKALEGRKHL
jgi:recombination protein RecR